MAHQLNPEVAAALAPLVEAAAGIPLPPAGDWKTRRDASDVMVTELTRGWPAQDVTVTSHAATAADGTSIPMRFYRPPGALPGSLVLYIHGGGMFLCSIDTHDPMCRRYAALSGVPLLAPDFRFAPEHPYPTSVEDCYTALRWAVEYAAELGVDPARIAVMGDSAGGGMAAGVALMARDRGGPALARQILTQPMLDDRTTTADPEIEPFATWTTDDNITGWGCLLGEAAGGPDTPAYAAPARADDLAGLPDTYLDIAGLDIFRNEDLEFAARLGRAGVPVECHLYPAVPHSFELFAPESEIARQALADRVRALRAL